MSAEFVSISSSSFDPSALAAQLTEHSAQGWSVVSIVPTGGDVTAFLTREAVAVEAAAETEAVVQAPVEAPVESAVEAPVEAAVVAAAVAEPAGWAVAPEPAPLAPIAEAAPAPAPYTPAPAPAPAYAPAPAAPAVPSGWYADPAGRFELRYWDGGAWTEHVSRAGQQFTDAPVA